MAILEAFIDAPSHFNAFTVFPILAPRSPVLPLLLSTEIQDEAVLTVRERGDEESSMLLARNNSYHDLLILAGETLPGEGRERMATRPFLIGGKSVTQIPTSSVSRDDWVRPERESEITEWVERFPIKKQQVGLLACLGPRVLGLEALGSPELYRPLHRRLLIRFIKEALSSEEPTVEEGAGVDPGGLKMEAGNLLASLESAERVETKRIGAGDYWKLKGPVTGGELVLHGTLIHLSVRPATVQLWAASGKEG